MAPDKWLSLPTDGVISRDLWSIAPSTMRHRQWTMGQPGAMVEYPPDSASPAGGAPAVDLKLVLAFLSTPLAAYLYLDFA
jgi:hypothetical protein